MLQGFASIFGLAVSICIGLAFVVAAIDKLRHRLFLVGVIANYRLLPEAMVETTARLLPFIELATGVALILGEWRVAPVVAIALLLVFAAAMAINLKRGRRHIDCGCGQSVLRQQLSWALVVRNLLLVVLLAPRPLTGGMPDLTGIGIAVMSGLSLFLVYLLFNTVIALATQDRSHSHV
ncbi:hypothetical protein BH10PSE12_BH10PSE12_18430 [soil metagenome]